MALTDVLVSVVVVHYRQPGELARTLAGLRRQTHPALELIVVDDGSPQPPTVPDDVRLLVQEDRGNRAGPARNAGAAVARGDLLCFLDADTTPESEYVARMVAATGPRTVAVGLRRHADLDGVPVDAPIEAAGPPRELPGPAWLADGYRTTDDLRRADDRTYRFVISAVLACPRAIYAPFEESFAEYGGEDWEWAWRAWLAGADLRHVPDAVAWHDGPDWSGRALDEDRQAVKNAEALRLADKVSVAGSRPLGIRASRPDVVVRLPDGLSEGAAFVCADALLAALPEAVVVAPEHLRRRFPADGRLVAAHDGRVRVTVELERAVRVPALAETVRGLAPGDAVTVPGVLTARTSRATGAPRTVDLHHTDIARHPDVEGHLGGWA